MSKEPFEFSRWFDKKLEEVEDRKSVLKYRFTDFLGGIVMFLLLALSHATQEKVHPFLFIIAPIIFVSLSVMERTIVRQGKRIRELEEKCSEQENAGD